MNYSEFLISRFENRNGSFSWRVDGRLNGVRIRRNFKTKEEACAEKAALETKAAQIESGRPNEIATFLTIDQVRDAEMAFRRLEGAGHSFMFCADFTLANYRTPERQRQLTEAVQEYLAAKERERDQRAITACQVIYISRELRCLLKAFPGCTVSELSAQRLTPYCERNKPSLKTVNNRRGILSTFFKFAFQRDWIATNPIEKVPSFRLARRRSSAATLTVAQARELMAFVETHEGGALVPFFALCLFAGIRPCVRAGEISKLQPEHVRLDEGVILIPPEVSKVHEKRVIAIQPNLAAWLRAYPLANAPIVPKNLQHSRARVAKRFALSADVMRHTFISMFIAKYRSLGEAALQAGNSEAVIRKHYLDVKSGAEAAEFFNILPTRAAQAGVPSAPAAATAPRASVDVQRAA
ncbi:hypothetical protein DB347_07005 [Opitutaceae bacterium EW11]|nr:hypothetical protein DB347_07005 [Opitutaceae bacterium EW11]